VQVKQKNDRCLEKHIIKRNKVVRYKSMTDDILRSDDKMKENPFRSNRLMKVLVDRKFH
jgi:hypothetical protein